MITDSRLLPDMKILRELSRRISHNIISFSKLYNLFNDCTALQLSLLAWGIYI